jgi:ribulose-phosphate 3-epimerase
MTITAGFGGQPFEAEHLSKVERAAEIRRSRDLPFRIQVDGGIDPETAARAVGAGADVLVAGSAIFHAPDPRAAARAIRAAATG